MKIAFVGKGGAGKSTVATLFLRWMQATGHPLLAVDADINMHLPSLLGTDFPAGRQLSAAGPLEALQRGLLDDARGLAPADMLPTTPPDRRSRLIRSLDDPRLVPVTVEPEPGLRLAVVGSYTEAGIGASCYHSALFAAENLLSHTHLAAPAALVCDMVAGTDAFAYSLHAQFDAIALVVEPTPEGVEVVQLYDRLAEEAGVAPLVHLIGNKVADAEDLAWLTAAVGRPLLGHLPSLPALRRARQQGALPRLDMLPDADALFAPLLHAARHPALDADARLALLHKLHRNLAQKDWVKTAYGDVAHHIDAEFRFAALETA